ncbi:MAG TPA: TraR/DksA C4-type zinc finger protein [Candidatus Binatia bacterium]|jgi:DnaK suppressor protein
MHETLKTAEIEELRRALVAARRRVLRARDAGEGELDTIESDREDQQLEPEEFAQEEQAADVRTRVTARQYAELRQIDGALERIDRSTYGACIDCEKPIAVERLRSEPWAARCAECEARSEAAPEPDRIDATARPQDFAEDIPDEKPDGEPDEGLAPAPIARDLEVLDDAEVAETIREAFLNEVGEALDDVRILCRDGVVTLAGEVANEALPEIARRIVEDETGYEVVDRMLVTAFAGEPAPGLTRGISGGQLPAEEPTEDEVEVAGETSEDILEVEEEGLTFVPPLRPVPER